MKLFVLFIALFVLSQAETSFEIQPDPDGSSTEGNKAVYGKVVILNLWDNTPSNVPNDCGGTCISDTDDRNGYEVTVEAATPFTMRASQFNTLAADTPVFLNSGAMTVAPGPHAKWDISWSQILAKRDTSVIDQRASSGDLATYICSQLSSYGVFNTASQCVSSRRLLAKRGIFSALPFTGSDGTQMPGKLVSNSVWTAYDINLYSTVQNFNVNILNLMKFYKAKNFFHSGCNKVLVFVESGYGGQFTTTDTDEVGNNEVNTDSYSKYKLVAKCINVQNNDVSCSAAKIVNGNISLPGNPSGWPVVQMYGDYVNGGTYDAKFEGKVIAGYCMA
jgi:hypothetical protein